MAVVFKSFSKRKSRVRSALRKVSGGKPRLSVFKSNKYIYVQLIDDVNSKTLASASSLEKEVKDSLKSTSDKAAAAAVGKLIAKRALELNVEALVFDKGGYKYHGKVEALANAAREAGLKF